MWVDVLAKIEVVGTKIPEEEVKRRRSMGSHRGSFRRGAVRASLRTMLISLSGRPV
jgi:hypothetical protein